MRADRMRQSENVEDRRGMGGGGFGGRRVAVGGVGGVGGLILLLLYLFLGGNPSQLIQPGGGGGGGGTGGSFTHTPANDAAAQFVARVLGDTEDVWTEQFRKLGREYTPPTLVLFSGGVESACGTATSAVGPFYCPLDQKVYIDLDFFAELRDRFGAPGDFAQAYVIAHEVGHHVQNLLGTMEQVHSRRAQGGERENNEMSVRLELQADFLAGVWAHHAQEARQVLEAGDIEEGLRAAAAIGDDRLQRQSRGYVVPDSFTHGSSAQRVKWFRRGLETGDIRQGDTFSVEAP
jgi:predicted metalloprotease